MRSSSFHQLCLSLSLILIGAPNLHSNPNLTGQILDSQTHAPIPMVNILIQGKEAEAGGTSDEQGEFTFQVKPGPYQLMFSHIGYEKQWMKIAIDSSTMLHITLIPKPWQAPGLMVSSNPYQRDSLLTHHALDARSLANVPALGEPDVLRALSFMPGVIASNDLKGEYHVRGGAADENLILLDGIEIRHPYHVFGIVGTFNLPAISGIDFYPGLLPVELGGKLSSALLVNTQNNRDERKTHVNASLLSCSVVHKNTWATGNIMLALRRTYFDLLLKMIDKPFGYYFYDGNLSLKQKLGKQWQLACTGFFSNDHMNPVANDELENGEEIEDPDAKDRWGNRVLGLQLNYLNKQCLWNNSLSYANYFNDFDDRQSEVTVNNRVNTLAGETRLRVYSPVTTTLGLFFKQIAYDYFWEDADAPAISNDLEDIFYDGVPAYFDYETSQHCWGGYGSIRKTLHSLVTLQLGSRFTVLNQKVKTSPRLSLFIQYPFSWSWRVNYGENIQWQTYGKEGIEWAIGSPAFPAPRPLRVQLSAVSLKKEINQNISMEIEVYQKNLPSITRLAEGDFPTFEYGTGEIRGVDVFLTRLQGKITTQLAYSWMESIYRFHGDSFYPDWDLRHAFKGLVGFHIGKGWSTHISMQAQSGIPYTEAGFYVPMHTLSTSSTTSTGVLYWKPVSGPYNGARTSPYIRTDLLFKREWVKNTKHYSVYLQILNILFRRNTIRQDMTSWCGSSSDHDTGLPILPSLGFSMEF